MANNDNQDLDLIQYFLKNIFDEGNQPIPIQQKSDSYVYINTLVIDRIQNLIDSELTTKFYFNREFQTNGVNDYLPILTSLWYHTLTIIQVLRVREATVGLTSDERLTLDAFRTQFKLEEVFVDPIFYAFLSTICYAKASDPRLERFIVPKLCVPSSSRPISKDKEYLNAFEGSIMRVDFYQFQQILSRLQLGDVLPTDQQEPTVQKDLFWNVNDTSDPAITRSAIAEQKRWLRDDKLIRSSQFGTRPGFSAYQKGMIKLYKKENSPWPAAHLWRELAQLWNFPTEVEDKITSLQTAIMADDPTWFGQLINYQARRNGFFVQKSKPLSELKPRESDIIKVEVKELEPMFYQGFLTKKRNAKETFNVELTREDKSPIIDMSILDYFQGVLDKKIKSDYTPCNLYCEEAYMNPTHFGHFKPYFREPTIKKEIVDEACLFGTYATPWFPDWFAPTFATPQLRYGKYFDRNKYGHPQYTNESTWSYTQITALLSDLLRNRSAIP